MHRLDRFWVGFITGLALPALFVYLFIGLRYQGELSPWALLERLYELRGLTALIAVAVLPNLMVFYFYMNREYLKGGRGIMMVVMTYSFMVAFFYFRNT